METMNISRKRSAFTLIELLVVIAIIGVLVGLLLPAVQQAREAARRSACGNKMKQNALAMHTYADANKHLPSGTNRRSYGSTAGNAVWKTFTVELMPFIEMSSVYDNLDLSENQLSGNVGTPSNWVALAPSVRGNPIYTAQFCPSDPDAFSGQTVDGKYLGGWGINNNRRSGGRSYDVSLGPTGFPANTPDCPNAIAAWCRTAWNWWNSSGTGNNPKKLFSVQATPGVFNWSYEFKCKFKDITDGTSATLLLIERRPGLHQRSAMYGPEVGVPTSIRPNSSYIDDKTSAGNNPQRAKNCGASSLHAGGVFGVATADGAGHWLNESIDFQVYNFLGNRMDSDRRGTLPE